LKAREIGSPKFVCAYIEFVSAQEAEKENELKGETLPEEG
jgi:hypothetical protein